MIKIEFLMWNATKQIYPCNFSFLWHECSDPYDSKQKFNIDIKNNTSSILIKQSCLLKIAWPKKVIPTKQVWMPKQIQGAVAFTSVTTATTLPKKDDATIITSSPSPIDSTSLRQISKSMDMP